MPVYRVEQYIDEQGRSITVHWTNDVLPQFVRAIGAGNLSLKSPIPNAPPQTIRFEFWIPASSVEDAFAKFDVVGKAKADEITTTHEANLQRAAILGRLVT